MQEIILILFLIDTSIFLREISFISVGWDKRMGFIITFFCFSFKCFWSHCLSGTLFPHEASVLCTMGLCFLAGTLRYYINTFVHMAAL